jgi:hypothetical protein
MRAFGTFHIVQEHCIEACRQRAADRDRRRSSPPPPPSPDRGIYIRDNNPELPSVTKALAPPPLPWEAAAG